MALPGMQVHECDQESLLILLGSPRHLRHRTKTLLTGPLAAGMKLCSAGRGVSGEVPYKLGANRVLMVEEAGLVPVRSTSPSNESRPFVPASDRSVEAPFAMVVLACRMLAAGGKLSLTW